MLYNMHTGYELVGHMYRGEVTCDVCEKDKARGWVCALQGGSVRGAFEGI